MRMHRVSLGDFTPGAFAVPQNPVGLGDFVPGLFAVPQNPISDAQRKAIQMVQSGMGEFVPAAFWLEPVPIEVGLGDGCPCGCGGTCGCGAGLGQIDFSWSGTGIMTSVESAMGSTTPSQIPNSMVYVAGGILVFLAFFQKPQTRYRRR